MFVFGKVIEFFTVKNLKKRGVFSKSPIFPKVTERIASNLAFVRRIGSLMRFENFVEICLLLAMLLNSGPGGHSKR